MARSSAGGEATNERLGIPGTNDRGDEPGGMGDALPFVDLGTGRVATQIDGGQYHNCALFDDASMKCWGYNNYGQLGYGDTTGRGHGFNDMGYHLDEVDVGTGRTVTLISTGWSSTCALLDAGEVKCWGLGSNGRLGQGDTENRGNEAGEMGDDLPAIDLGTGRTAVRISNSYEHACALLDDATVKCWGHGAYGRLGYGDEENRGDEPGEMGDNLPAVDLGTTGTVVDIDSGQRSNCALFADGRMKCWGRGDGGFGLGHKDYIGDEPGEMGDALPFLDFGAGRLVEEFFMGSNHFCALLDDSSLTCFGDGFDGRLGSGSTTDIGDDPGEMGDAWTPVELGMDRYAVRISNAPLNLCADGDGDGVCDPDDICASGDDADDDDLDGVPDACDSCPLGDDALDDDLDGVPDACDLCALGDDAVDDDLDGVPDACDVCPVGDDTLDDDFDGVPDACDVCPVGDDTIDDDRDGVPNACDGFEVLDFVSRCPDGVQIRTSGSSPGAVVTLMGSDATGSATLATGACAGVATELGPLRVTLTTVADGRGLTEWRLPAQACGRYVQLVDEDTCTLSDALAP